MLLISFTNYDKISIAWLDAGRIFADVGKDDLCKRIIFKLFMWMHISLLKFYTFVTNFIACFGNPIS